MTFNTELHKLHQDSPLVWLMDVDLTNLGGGVYHFTSYFGEGNSVAFGGTTYLSFGFQVEGFEASSTGTMPQPKLTVSNIVQTLLSDVVNLNDCVGGRIALRRTYKKFLDGEGSADHTQYLGPDTYYIAQKLSHNSQIITFKLSSVIDRFGMKLPRRQFLKDKGFPGISRYRGAV